MTTPRSLPSPTPPRMASLPDPGSRRALREMWTTYVGNIRTRRQLLELSETQLRDVGLTRAQALREAWQPIWRNTAYPVRDDIDHNSKREGTSYAAIG